MKIWLLSNTPDCCLNSYFGPCKRTGKNYLTRYCLQQSTCNWLFEFWNYMLVRILKLWYYEFTFHIEYACSILFMSISEYQTHWLSNFKLFEWHGYRSDTLFSMMYVLSEWTFCFNLFVISILWFLTTVTLCKCVSWRDGIKPWKWLSKKMTNGLSMLKHFLTESDLPLQARESNTIIWCSPRLNILAHYLV